ncbi:MAG TPA: CZB domain-containing protein [Rhodocyclaceae bacterium]|nr:CZB domain-containing protein [Rhodocyclaceae bacterium]
MGIFDWFKQQAAGDAGQQDTPPAGDESQGAVVGGLNFMTAIDAHMKWKTRLENYIQGTSNEVLQADVVCRDDECVLGKWIYGPGGEQFGGIDTFHDMKTQHAHFHTCAGKVLATTQLGRTEDALRMLQHGDYVRASERVKMLLAKLYVQIAESK